MVNALAIMIALSAVADPVGVVRFVRGAVTIGGEDAKPGAAIARGALLDTGADGYAELALDSTVRVRISSTTRVVLEEHALKLISGRVWIQATQRAFLFEAPGMRADLAGRSSVIAEHAHLAGATLAVRAGSAVVIAREQRLEVKEREVAVLDDGALRVRPGGTGLGALASREAEQAIGDLLGFGPFLLAHAQKVELGSYALRGVQDLLRTDAEIAGSDAGPGGLLVEDALRPPPFFDEEVPPKGPNVRVEVTFSDE